MPFSGQRLREIREAARIDRGTLADEVGSTRQYISHLENGIRGNPTYDLVEKLAKALSVDCRTFAVADETEGDEPPKTTAKKPATKPKKSKGKKAE